MDDKWPKSMTGCYIDGHWGQYGVTRLIDLASQAGMPVDEEDQSKVDAYNNGDGEDIYEDVYYLSDKAEQWMNDNLALDGFSFGWNDGEFFYWENTEWEEV